MISMDKKYCTQNGKSIRLLCVDAPGVYPIVGICEEVLMRWTIDGKYWHDKDSVDDLIEMKPERVMYANLYEGLYVWKAYGSLDAAKSMRCVGGCDNLGYLEIRQVEGEDPKVSFHKY